MQSYRFKPRARLIRTIGDKLVSGPVAAILELVKNSHDADSEDSKIEFKTSLHTGYKTIEISDHGSGMSFTTVVGSWMEPATDSKVKRSHSDKGRRLLGSKGIGRFAASRLGDSMTLTTSCFMPELDKVEITTLRVNWNKFNEENYLDQIPINIKKSYRAANYPTGTKIRIRNLRDEWVANEILDLNRELRRLISPFQIKDTAESAENLPFEITLDLSKLNKSNIPLSLVDEKLNNVIKIEPTPILDSADYEVVGKFDANGKFIGSIEFNSVGKPYEERIEEDFPLIPNSGLTSCGEVSVRLLIFDRESSAIDALIERAGLDGYGKRAARQILDDMTGVGIYRDHFRIRPYGDKDQDWLELSRRRVDNPSMRISPNQIAGFISISDESNSNLIERSSREGLEANGSYKRLQELVTNLLGTVVEPMRRKVREGTGKGRRKPRHERFIEAAEFSWKEKILAEIPAPRRETARLEIEAAQEELKKRIIEQIEHERLLEARATLGKIIAEVLHELRNPLKSVSSLLKHIKFDWKKITTAVTFEDALKKNYYERTLVNIDQTKRMERLLSQLDPLSTKRSGPPTKQDAFAHIQSSIEVMYTKAKENGIIINFSGSKEANYYGYGDEIQTVLINLIDNAIFWLKKSSKTNAEIRINLSSKDGHIKIEVEDNGPGIKSEYIDSVFEAGFSTKASEGQGLGLAISREALARIGGSLNLLKFTSGCTFEIVLKEFAYA